MQWPRADLIRTDIKVNEIMKNISAGSSWKLETASNGGYIFPIRDYICCRLYGLFLPWGPFSSPCLWGSVCRRAFDFPRQACGGSHILKTWAPPDGMSSPALIVITFSVIRWFCRSALRLSKHYVSVRYYAQHVVLLVTDGQYANVLAFHDEDDPFEGVPQGYIAYGRWPLNLWPSIWFSFDWIM